MAPHLPDDLAFDLLVRLPIKKLFQFNCVSKSWCLITSNSTFTEAYNNRNSSSSCLIFAFPDECKRSSSSPKQRFYCSTLRESKPKQFVSHLRLPLLEYQGFTQVVNGLVCFHSLDGVFVGNVLTGEIMRLPDPPEHDCGDDSTTSTTYYFGFDPVSEVYKLLRAILIKRFCTIDSNPVSPGEGLPIYSCEILSLGSCDSSWRKLDDGDVYLPLEHRSFHVNGVLYWINQEWPDDRLDLVAFDLCNESFLSVKLPSEIRAESLPFYRFAQFQGGLSMISAAGKSLIIYILDENARHNWTRQEVILPKQLQQRHDDRPLDIAFAGNLPTGEILLVNTKARGLCVRTLVYSYDCEKNRFKGFVLGKFPMRNHTGFADISCSKKAIGTLDVLLHGGGGIK